MQGQRCGWDGQGGESLFWLVHRVTGLKRQLTGMDDRDSCSVLMPVGNPDSSQAGCCLLKGLC